MNRGFIEEIFNKGGDPLRFVFWIFLIGFLAWGVYYSMDYSIPAKKTKILKVKTGNPGKNVGIYEGKVAPNFSSINLQGKPVYLSDFRGKKVILNFWGSWCPPCRHEMPNLQKYFNTRKGDDFVILAVDSTFKETGKKAVLQFVHQLNLDFPIVLDKSGDITHLYHVTSYPTTYFIGKKGIIQKVFKGPMTYNFIQKSMFHYRFYTQGKSEHQ